MYAALRSTAAELSQKRSLISGMSKYHHPPKKKLRVEPEYRCTTHVCNVFQASLSAHTFVVVIFKDKVWLERSRVSLNPV